MFWDLELMQVGRVGKCSHGANLLLSKDPKEVFTIASELENFNNERKFLEKDMFNKIEKKIVLDPNEPVIVLSGHNLHGGIIGIIASRLKDKFNKPTDNYIMFKWLAKHQQDLFLVLILAL